MKYFPHGEGLYCPKYNSVILGEAVHVHLSNLTFGACLLPVQVHQRVKVEFEDRRRAERRLEVIHPRPAGERRRHR